MKTNAHSRLMGSSTGIFVAVLLIAAVPSLLVPSFQATAFASMDDKTMQDKDNMTMKDNKASMLVEDKPKYSSFKGQISNVQLGRDGKPEWIQSGIWVLRISYNENSEQPSIGFIARFLMVKPDGTSTHTHTITRLAVTGHSMGANTHVINGTATITMPAGPVQGVPVIIKVINDAVLAVWIGPSGVDGHFGTDPTYGTIIKSQLAGGMMEGGQMIEMPTKLTKTNVPVTIPLTRGFADGNEVFYISTEASDKQVADHLTNLTGSRVAFAPSLARTPASALATIYAFTNGLVGTGPFGFQPNVADSEPGDPEYSPLWRINTVEWQDGATPRELTSEDNIVSAQQAGEVKITATEFVVNCPFVKWQGGSLPVRQDKTLTDDTQYGGGQVLEINTADMTVTFVAHRGFAPDGSTIYYIATDASVKELADALGVTFVNKTGSALLTSSASDLWVFTNGIQGTGPIGFQASIASSNVGDAQYSPLWRIIAATWTIADQARFLTSAGQIAAALGDGKLTTELAAAVVNCPFVEVE